MGNLEIKNKIIELLFPEKLPSIESIEGKYPARTLDPGAMVTRIAPSPTGFMHLGTVYTALINARLAHQSQGVFFVRIEDTDKKREVAGAIKVVTDALDHYHLNADEGEGKDGVETGAYGPYKQSDRAEIYQAYVKKMLEDGLAYPCFATSEELDEMRQQQEAENIRPGYYGQWAVWRDKSGEEILEVLENKKPFVIRFKSNGDWNTKIKIKDLLLGERELSENDQDIVILKSEGLPTYHMAHVIDDHLMGTTHVIRGNEWFASLSLHVQLFAAMNWSAPSFGHIFPIQKMEGASKRKLSKRKDPEANVEYYDEHGYPVDGIIEYLLNLANSNFEDWRKANPDMDNREFALSIKKLANSSGPLFDFEKLHNICKDKISKYSADKVYSETLVWAEKHDQDLFALLNDNSDYVKRILDIERGNALKPRKDVAKWSDVRTELEYFFDHKFKLSKSEALELLGGLEESVIKNIVGSFKTSFDENDDKDAWFAKIKLVAEANGFALNTKDYKANPENFQGSVADVAKIFRVLLCGKVQTPDLHSIIQVMGKDRVFKRLNII